MANIFNSVVYIFFCIEIVTFATCVEITVPPQDTTILKDATAQFMCIVNGLSENQVVKWFRDNKMISEGTQVISEFSQSIIIDTDEKLGHHNLVIDSVKSEDNGTKYYCAIYESDEEKVTSGKGLLIVNEIPNLNYNPSCKQSDKQFSENRNARLMCTSKKGYPTVQLRWYYNGREFKKNTRITDTVTSETTVMITKQHKEAVFVCSLTTEADNDVRKNCTVGPIRVLYKPTTEIQGQDIIYEGTDGVYVCYSDASPEVEEYKWILPESLPTTKYELENNEQVLRLKGLTKTDNGTYIECRTRNSQGKGVGSFTVKVIDNETERHYLPTGSSSVNPNKRANSTSTAAMLSVVGGCLLFLASIMAFVLCSILLYSRRQAGVLTGNHIPQPDVYYVPKDSIDGGSTSMYQTGKWKRSIATQVPNDLELESITYAEIEEGKKLINTYRTLKSSNIKEDTK